MAALGKQVSLFMDKLKPTGETFGRVFNSSLGRVCICRKIAYITERSNLKLKTGPKHVLGSLPLAFTLPGLLHHCVHKVAHTHDETQ